MTDKDFDDEKLRALVSNTLQSDERNDQALNNRENNKTEFSKSRNEEIQALLRNGTFEVVKMDDIREGTRIFVSLFVDIMKPTNVEA